ncbi:hypothetical protein NE237_018606 [Protea cynaroides]|uniref:Uncharacterized protein n=1 Tax=Protea cynaroides TaxID=273540 RepID=A0A9Q0KAA0_9MAGN|nr:hypothetical protein NE237_018606 [Protea cynaroides]
MGFSSNPSRTNPNLRNQESSGIRKSFNEGFNPVTPANSPADFSQRNASHREGLVSLRNSYEQKENEKNQNLKPARVRSPTVSTVTKSFMAPTVSASSKINASPRKKVLTERNEEVGTSTSFSAGKSPFTAMNPSGLPKEVRSKLETAFDSKVHSESPKKSDASLESPVPEVPRETPDLSLFSPEPRTVDSKCSDADLGSKIKPSLSQSPVVAPYDPKTNYLSPRPRFLHYKPNPRIEVYLNKDQGFNLGEGKRLEERFSSESSSETENTEESQSPSHQKEYEDDDSSEIISEENDENDFSEPEIKVRRVNDAQKSHSLTRFKSISLLLFLVVACLCFPVTDTPIHCPSLFSRQTFSRFDSPDKIAEIARLWSVSSVSYLSKLISFPNEMEEIGPLQFPNSTSSEEKHLADHYQTVDYGYNDREKILDVETVENLKENIADIQTNVEFEEQPQLIVLASDLKPQNPDKGEFLEEGDFDSFNNIEPINLEAPEKCSNTKFEDQSPPLSKVWGVEPDISEVDSPGKNDADSPTNIELANAETTAHISDSDHSHGSFHDLEAPESSHRESNYWFPEREVLGISSVVLTLLIAALLYHKQNKASIPKASVPVNQLATKKLSLCSSVSASSDHLNQGRTSPEEVERVGQSGPSEMSSTLQGSSNRGKRDLDSANEVQSHGRKPSRSAKRESLASSSEFSTGSPSYGSFTTFEKFQSKHKSGDEGMVTPVRRSSRIRKQITSP